MPKKTSDRLKELRAKAREIDKRFRNARGEGDSRNEHLARREIWYEINKEEERLKNT